MIQMHFLHVTTVSTVHVKRMSATVLIALTADCAKGRSRFSQRLCQRVMGGECLSDSPTSPVHQHTLHRFLRAGTIRVAKQTAQQHTGAVH